MELCVVCITKIKKFRLTQDGMIAMYRDLFSQAQIN